MTTFLVEKEPGFGQTAQGITIPGKIDKMGYKGVETTEMVMEGARVPASSILGGEAGRGRGFYQMMDGVEVGRVNVAAARAASRSGPSSWRSPTPRPGRRSASRSPSTRRSRSSWPRWPPRSRPRTRSW
jgi:hypothetical protein